MSDFDPAQFVQAAAAHVPEGRFEDDDQADAHDWSEEPPEGLDDFPPDDPDALPTVAATAGRKGRGKAGTRAPAADPKETQADRLYRMGRDGFLFLRNSGQVYAVQKGGAPIARPLRAKGGGGQTGSLRQMLVAQYVNDVAGVPSTTATASAMEALDAFAMHANERPVWLRTAPDPEDRTVTWLDLGEAGGRSARVSPGGWELAVPDPATGPLWRRTRLLDPLAVPVAPAGGWKAGLGLLRDLVPMDDRSWPMAVALLLAALRPQMPRPIGYFTGEQGTGKTTVARQLLRIIDGPTADVRAVPKTEEDLAVVIAAGWMAALDNLSGIPGWLSDALCRIVTGDSCARRGLFTDDDVALLVFQRPLLLTSIDSGALRGDLAERMVPLGLVVIPPSRRRTEARLWREYRRALPEVLGGLLDLAVLVWAKLPEAETGLAVRPRMADWAELLWALDRVTGWQTLATYTNAQDDLVDDVLDGDTVAKALMEWLESSGGPGPEGWSGTAGDLLKLLQPLSDFADKGWPRTGAVMSGRLIRAAPALRRRGIEVAKTRTGKARALTVTRAPVAGPGPSADQLPGLGDGRTSGGR